MIESRDRAPAYVRRRKPETWGRLEAAARAVAAARQSDLEGPLDDLGVLLDELDAADQAADEYSAAVVAWRALQDAWMTAHQLVNVGPSGPRQGHGHYSDVVARWSFDGGRTARCKRHADQRQLAEREAALADAWSHVEPGDHRATWQRPSSVDLVQAIAADLGLSIGVPA